MTDREDIYGPSPLQDMPGTLYGAPVIRQGDQVFILGSLGPPPGWQDQVEQMKRLVDLQRLRSFKYPCPFHFLDEYDKWFTWQKRIHFDGEHAGQVTVDMIQDVEWLEENKIDHLLIKTMEANWLPQTTQPIGFANYVV